MDRPIEASTQNKVAIQAQGLTKWYGRNKQTPALEGLNLEIAPGQLYGLVGPDGAGKTTTLRIMATVMLPSRGSASIAGLDVAREAEKIHRISGYMPQNFSLYADLSVMENLNFFADINHVPRNRKRERIQEMLAFSRLERFTGRRAGNLSGGMKKKLALACALIHDPRILLLDEPSTGVDPVLRRELWLILAQVVAQGVTVLVSTPYMDEAERCNQVGILYNGSLLTSGTPATLIDGLPFDILEVKSRPRKRMRAVVSEQPGILSWRPVGDRLRMAVARQDGDAGRLLEELRTALAADGQEIRLLRRARPDMEDVFVHLMGEQRGSL